MEQRHNMDMLRGPLAGRLLRFALPVALSSMLQQLFNAADTAVVGRFGDAGALAAVGANTEIVALIVTFSSGLSVGANVLLANRIGRRETGGLPDIVRTAVVFAALCGVLGMLAGQRAAGPLLRLTGTPELIRSSAEQYLRIYLLGYPFLLLYDFGAAALRARGESRYPFLALLASGILNVLLNLLFVTAFRLGVAGVALATALSTALSAAMVLLRLKKDAMLRLALRRPLLQEAYLVQILQTGVPSTLQGAVFCFANIFVQTAVNGFGPTVIAGSTIAMNFEYFAYYAITAFGQTATTFISQNHAAGQYGRCRKILLLCLGFALLSSFVMIVPVICLRTRFCGLFSPESAVIGSACARLLCILLFEPACCLYEIPAGALRGAGHAVLPSVSAMVGTCAFRIVWICTLFRAQPSLPLLYRAFPLSWLATIILTALSFLIARPFRK